MYWSPIPAINGPLSPEYPALIVFEKIINNTQTYTQGHYSYQQDSTTLSQVRLFFIGSLGPQKLRLISTRPRLKLCQAPGLDKEKEKGEYFKKIGFRLVELKFSDFLLM